MIERLTTAERLTLRLTVPMRALTVWQALTARAHIARWWGEHVRLEPRLGGRFVERWRNDGRDIVTTGAIIAWDPPRELALSWSDDDWTAATELRITLQDVDEGCLITLDHGGWERLAESHRAPLIEAHADGWVRHLDNLGRYLSGN
ncbi:MAG: SRPBCC domain-containing protein [Alphaproteobacteria bacterium]|nr:SRPBCC domain-containing protein [Alphaproteobacteria bacterium]